MPSVRLRRSNYSSLAESVDTGTDRPRSRRQTTSSSQRPTPHDTTPNPFLFPPSTERLDQLDPRPRFSSLVYHAARHNSLSFRTRAASPLSEQGAPHARARSYTTGARPAISDIFSPLVVPTDNALNASLSRRDVGAAGDVENQQAQLLADDQTDSDEDSESLHDDVIVDHLDVVDPELATIGVLANAANAIVFPPVSAVYPRRATVTLSIAEVPVTRPPSVAAFSDHELDTHVNEVLSKRAIFKRIMKGVWAFLKTPMGVVVGLYGFLVVFWGTAIVLFLLKWINVHNQDTQGQWVELSCQIENTLFCITGLGLAPWRIQDTYRIAKIWWYKRRTRYLRRKQGLPPLFDSDDLPDPRYDPQYVHVLSEKEQEDLHRQQVKFAHSQTWYRPHGTATHRAFPIDYALAICSLNVGNSIFQAMLAACMWSMDRYTRPAWSTGSLIPAAFLCGIFSGVLIWRGGQRTKRTAEVEKVLRAALAARSQEKDGHMEPLSPRVMIDNGEAKQENGPNDSPVCAILEDNSRIVSSPEPEVLSASGRRKTS